MNMHLFSVPKQDPQPRILTPVLVNRLALTNRVIRIIRRMGFLIVDVSLTDHDSVPVVSICVDPGQSARELFDVASPGSLYRDSETVSVTIGGVRVIWVRPELLSAMSARREEVSHAN